MNIAALVNPTPEAPRRSPSNPHSITGHSPATSAAKLPTPPLSNHKSMPLKRKRNDPKPIWAVREHEVLDGRPLQPREQPQPSRPPPSTPRTQPQPPPNAQANGSPSSSTGPPTTFTVRELVGYERPVTNQGEVYDEISRRVCDFIWTSVVDNAAVREAVHESPGTEVEIEARWGQIQDRTTGLRLVGMHDTECVVKRQVSESTKFESTMSLEQHKKMNHFLNTHVTNSKQPAAMRAEIDYKHTKEEDQFYELDQAGFDLLPLWTRKLLSHGGQRQRIRITRDIKTKQVIRKIIKCRIGNLEISSPHTEWDYRIGINLEVQFPGPVEGLNPIVESGRSVDSMIRYKDRVSYSWLSAYQIDLTQVSQGQGGPKNHELELELNGALVIQEADKIKHGQQDSNFEHLVDGMMNNLRVLSREITPPK